MTVKEKALRAIESSPDDSSIDDLVYKLHLINDINIGIQQLDNNQGFSTSDVKDKILNG